MGAIPSTLPTREGPLPDQRRLIWVLLTLTAVSGLVDAVSFLRFGTVFAANMTGNVIFLAFGLVGAGSISIYGPLVALPSFLVGALGAGRLAAELASRPRAWLVAGTGVQTTLVATAALLVGAGVLTPGGPRRLGVVALLALAMGIQNALARRLGVADLTTTVLTLTLTGLAAESLLARGGNPRAVRRSLAVLAMFAGALVGALLILNTAVGITLAATAAVLTVATAGFAYAARPDAPPAHSTDEA